MRSLFIVALIWFLVALFIPESVFVRDSPEFVISAFFLDVAHPPGFPTYSQLANLFGLLPIGPIAWRISAFAAACGLVALVLAAQIMKEVIKKCFDKNITQANTLFAVLTTILFILVSPGFLRQSYTPEVYLLNAVFLELAVLIFIKFRERLDRRLLFLGAFISGLALGSHASYLLALVVFFLITLTYIRCDYRAIATSCCFFILGLSIYGYLPLRAMVNPPLNTGMTLSPQRFWAQISDRRDFDLNKSSISEGNYLLNRPHLSGALQSSIGALRRLSKEVSFPLLIIALVGLGALCWSDLRLGLLLIGIAASNLGFFIGWSSDPWIPSIVCLSLFFSFAVAHARALTKSSLWMNTLAIGCLAFGFLQSDFLTNLDWLRRFDFPRRKVKEMVRDVPSHAVFLTEPNWYLVAYSKFIERYRDDLKLAYVPDIYFPEYFRPIAISNTNGDRYVDASVDDYHQRLGNFLSFALKSGPVFLEPAASINGYLKSGLIFMDNGQVSLELGKTRSLQAQHLASRSAVIADCLADLLISPGFVKEEIRFLCEVDLTAHSEALSNSEFNTEAANLVEAMCLAPQANICSDLVYNNVAVYEMRSGDLESAVRWLAYGIERGGGYVGVLRQNLNGVLNRIGGDQIQDLFKDPVVSKIISKKADI